jgi:predicted Zn-ribbon and HTH transcriptional regulator
VEENKEMITLNDLRICDNCGNVYSSKVGIKIINRCPACDLWKKGKAL